MTGIRRRQHALTALVATGAVRAALVVPTRPARGGDFPPAIETQLESLTDLLIELHAPGARLGVSVGGQARFLGVAGVAVVPGYRSPAVR